MRPRTSWTFTKLKKNPCGLVDFPGRGRATKPGGIHAIYLSGCTFAYLQCWTPSSTLGRVCRRRCRCACWPRCRTGTVSPADARCPAGKASGLQTETSSLFQKIRIIGNLRLLAFVSLDDRNAEYGVFEKDKVITRVPVNDIQLCLVLKHDGGRVGREVHCILEREQSEGGNTSGQGLPGVRPWISAPGGGSTEPLNLSDVCAWWRRASILSDNDRRGGKITNKSH